MVAKYRPLIISSYIEEGLEIIMAVKKNWIPYDFCFQSVSEKKQIVEYTGLKNAILTQLENIDMSKEAYPFLLLKIGNQ